MGVPAGICERENRPGAWFTRELERATISGFSAAGSSADAPGSLAEYPAIPFLLGQNKTIIGRRRVSHA